MSAGDVITGIAAFTGGLFFLPVVFWVARLLNLYVVVKEGEAIVYVLFGNVIGTIRDAGLHLLFFELGPLALLVPWFGKTYRVDMRLDQEYLRSQPVNSEEGTPMGIGVWYEMRVTNPVDYLFKNTDPQGSLRSNLANSVVRCLSNLPLRAMLENRHSMSRSVRIEVSPKSETWGYALGSVYIRKVHFRDANMIRQIEQKVVNRLRQVTSAIVQAGENQKDIVTSAAERKAAVEFARAAAVRPQVVGDAFAVISKDRDVTAALIEILEVQRIVKNAEAKLTLVPRGGVILSQLLGAEVAGSLSAASSAPTADRALGIGTL